MEKMISRIWIKKVLAVVFLLTMTGMDRLFAADIIRLTPPILNGSSPFIDIGLVQSELNSVVSDLQRDINEPFQNLNPKLPKLIGAFADSSVFASTGASLRGYQGYNAFALTVGAVGGVQLPLNVFSFVGNIANMEEEIDKLLAKIERDLDVQLGLNPQVVNAQLGINTRFLKGLYVGLKGGWMSLDTSQLSSQLPMSFHTWSIGPMVNYQLIPQFKLLGKLMVWRGLNVGAGFIYQSTSLKMDLPMNNSVGEYLPSGGYFSIDNLKLNLGFNVSTYTVPLEVVTSIRLLGLNTSVGVGADLGFGSADLKVSGKADYRISGLPYGIGQTPGSVSVSLGGENSPNFFNPKAMASLGFGVGPVIVMDIPVTWYFLNNGFNFGISLGIAL